MRRTKDYLSDDPRSVEPHFNDERTIRSAQPVVPLTAVANERRRRRFILGGAFVIACLLGSTAALALIRVRQPSLVADTTEDSASQESEQQAAIPNEPETAAIEASSDMQSVTDENSADAHTGRKKKSRKHSAASPGVRITITTNPASSDSGEARLVDQWEERRQRRVSRGRIPQQNPQQNHHTSDLFRIREIFEGPRRARRINNN